MTPMYGFRKDDFYPRPPRGGRPEERGEFAVLVAISIHALREEGDFPLVSPVQSSSYFYPRPPRGGRRCPLAKRGGGNVFLSTPSARRATDFHALSFSLNGISIHALREEGDSLPQLPLMALLRFLSTPSARRATLC